MADPQYPVNVIKDQWNKVASNVTVGWIHRQNILPKYLQTYRVVNIGNPDPTEKSEGVPMFGDFSNKEQISSADAIDIWVWPIGGDGVLRVDV